MFNISRVDRNRINSEYRIHESPFYKFICQDLIDRLAMLDINFNKILLINPILEELFVKELGILYPNHNLTIIRSINEIDSLKEEFDLIIFPFGMHWVSDVQKFLKQIYGIINDTGMFISNFLGGDTLSKLRRVLINLEHEFSKTFVPHISPFIQFEHINPLLQQAGFTENVTDMEALELEYETPLLLMKALKDGGQANAIEDGISYSITRNMYKQLGMSGVDPFIDNINLISFISTKTKRSIKLVKATL